MTNVSNEELALQGDQRQPVMPWHGGLFIPIEIALSETRSIIKIEGLDEAWYLYNRLCAYCSRFINWSSFSQAINELFEQEAERKHKLLSLLNKKPAIINYGPYYEIQAGGNNFTNQGIDNGDHTTLSNMRYQTNEDEQCGERDANDIGAKIKKALDVLQVEKLMKHMYDYTWVMEAMNQTKGMPDFITPSSFLAFVRDLGVENLPSKDSIELKQNKVSGKFPNWEFTDCDSTEAQRRINVGRRFLSAYRGK